MRRIESRPRADFAARAAEIGFEFAEIDGEKYWDESAHYVFTLREIEEDLEAPTQELAGLARDIVGRVVRDEALLRKLGLPQHAWDKIAESWKRQDPSLYGRFDFVYDGKGPAKLVLEYAGFETEPIKRGDRDNWVVFNIALRCPYVDGGRCVGETLPKTRFQNLFETRPDYANSMKRTAVKVAGRDRVLLTGLEVFEYDLVPEELMKVYFSFNAPANVETHEVRATLLYGEFTTAAPQAAAAGDGESKSPGFALKLLVFLVLSAGAFLGIRVLARRMSE